MICIKLPTSSWRWLLLHPFVPLRKRSSYVGYLTHSHIRFPWDVALRPWCTFTSCSGVLAHPIPEESGKRWSDAELAAQNPITALQIKRNESNRPCRIRARWETGCNLYLLQIRTRLGSMERAHQDYPSKGWQRGNPWSRSGCKPEDHICHRDFQQQGWLDLDVASSSLRWINLGALRRRWSKITQKRAPFPLLPTASSLSPVRRHNFSCLDPPLPLEASVRWWKCTPLILQFYF